MSTLCTTDDAASRAAQRTLRIAYLVKNYPASYETFIETQISGVASQGHTVDVIAMRPQAGSSDVTNELSVRYSARVPGNRLLRAAKTLTLAGYCAKFSHDCGWLRCTRELALNRLVYNAWPFRRHSRYDIIHCQFATLGMVAVQLRALGLLHGQIVTSVRGHDMNRLLHATRERREQLFDEGDLFLPVCDYFRDRLIAVGCDPQKVVVHRTGIDIARVRAATAGVSRSAEKIVIFVGRLTEKKGPHVAIEAIDQVRRAQPDVILEIVGDGPLRPRLEQMVRACQLTNHVRFAGRLPYDQTLRRIARATVLILPCQTAADGCEEGIPNVLKETMLLSVPVVTTHHAGIPELVTHGVTGYLAEPGDAQSMAIAVRDVRCDETFQSDICKNAKKYVELYYDCKAQSRQLVELYLGMPRDVSLDHRTSVV